MTFTSELDVDMLVTYLHAKNYVNKSRSSKVITRIHTHTHTYRHTDRQTDRQAEVKPLPTRICGR